MAAIQNLLERFGFVKLNRYGLVLTPEGRILSMRPAVMDDGLGGRVVGWQDSDLVATELARWEPAKPAAVTRVATRPLAPPPIPAPRITAAVPVVPAISAMPVAPKAEEPEDDWEWTIALARARAAAEEVELAAAPLARPAPRRTRQDTVPPPPVMRTQPMAGPRRLEAATIAAPSALPKVDGPRRLEAVALPRASSPRTIIPVPKLPVMKSPPRFEPVVRSSSMGAPHALPALPRRMAKGTGPVAPKADDTRPMISLTDVGDRTETSIPLADQTQQTVLPRIARAR